MSLLMLASRKSTTSGNSFAPNVMGWNYDTNQSTGQLLLVRSGSPTIAAPSMGISGYSKVLKGTTDTLNISNSGVVNTSDCTFVARISTTSTAGYLYFLDIIPTGSTRFQMRLGDSGFGNRLQICFNPSTINTCYDAPISGSNLSAAWYHIAVTRASNVITLYVNGTQTNMAIGTGSSYTNATITDSTSISGTTGMSVGGTSVNIAEWAFYNHSIYSGNFTPPTGYLV